MSNEKAVVITGATRGIGKNMALYFASRGYTVVGTGRDAAKLNELDQELKQFGSSNKAVALDIMDPSNIQDVVQSVVSDLGKIPVWINNAGLFKAIGPTWEVDRDAWIGDLSTNLIGTFQCLHAVIPVMLRQGFGRIINVVGGGTGNAFKYGCAYGVSKTGVARLTENAAAELEGSRVQCFAMDPGLNRTDMTEYQLNTEAGQHYLPVIKDLFDQKKDVPPERAPKLAFALAEGKLDAYHGRIVSVHEDIEQWESRSDGLSENPYKLRISLS
ncbi:SDR family NAD(P)-dependent oxidoreductase [Paenibacillus humicola]|uniref:SDR family NAD(P)-dependent oxidoreductase n=1 Tax=Paenibacillus humicola TaxID=3110540 RepID=UPI00237C28A8|nr:SDR family oxidoreductase [Paenibacillus humicola]